ncbi:Undecaprenyl-phosphate 4-deoxy-4-formamido-L-arabinose transferase [Oligella ureolytica]
MQKKPEISIIIPCYNSEKKIERTIQTCIQQEYQNIEIIVVDDKSTDNSLSILKKISAYEPRLKIIEHQKNLGTFAARASGITFANGKMIIFLDSDDKLLPKTATIIKQAIVNYNADIVFYSVKNEGNKLRLSKPLPKSPLYGEEILKGFICDPSEPVWGIGGKAIKRSILLAALKQLTFIDQKFLFAEDAILCFVSTALAKTSISIDEALYIYIENPHSITQDNSNVKKINDQLDLALNYFNQLNNSKLKKHKYFELALHKTNRILNATKILNQRFEKGYLTSYLKAWHSVPHIKYLIIIILYIISLGRFKR